MNHSLLFKTILQPNRIHLHQILTTCHLLQHSQSLQTQRKLPQTISIQSQYFDLRQPNRKFPVSSLNLFYEYSKCKFSYNTLTIKASVIIRYYPKKKSSNQWIFSSIFTEISPIFCPLILKYLNLLISVSSWESHSKLLLTNKKAINPRIYERNQANPSFYSPINPIYTILPIWTFVQGKLGIWSQRSFNSNSHQFLVRD